MATLRISGDNASYTLTLSGMSTSTRYHVFIADLSSSGSVTGYKCIRSSLGSSSTWTYNGSSNSPYSNYRRSVFVYTSTAATIHSVGTIYDFDDMSSGCTYMDSDYIPAKAATTYMLNVTCEGVSIGYTVSTNGATGTLSDGYSRNFDFGTTKGYITLTSVTPSSRYSHPVTGSSTTGTTSWTVTDSSGTITTAGKTVNAYSGGGVRYVTLSAVRKTYTISYNANGGSGAPSSQTFLAGTSVKLSSTVPTRDGHLFLGWATYSTATSAMYSAGEIVTFGTSTILYAVWEVIEKTYYGRFTLNANGGTFPGTGYTSISWPTGGNMSNTGTGGAYVSTTLPVSGGSYVPTRSGYTFVGWVIKQGETTPDYYSGETAGFTATSTSSSNPSKVTLYAVWMEDYSGSITVNSYTYDRNDKSFQGALGVTVTISPELGSWTLKASHTVTGTSVSKTIISSGSTTLVLPFLYISSNQTYTLTLTAPDGTVVASIVVPCLDVPEYTLTFNANGGTGAPSALKTYGNVAKVTIPKTIPKLTKHKFLGWALGASSTVLEVSVDALPCEYSFTQTMTLYAVWEEIEDITLFYWNGNDENDALLIKKGNPVKDALTATRWNLLLYKINEVSEACDIDFTYTNVNTGNIITHGKFNVARTGLVNIKASLGANLVTIPAAQNAGDTMYAILFNGSASLKGALNSLIGVFNNG